jgi:hypothetical protein
VELLERRTWSWFLDRLHGLFECRSRVHWAWLGPSGQATVREMLANGQGITPWL